MDKNEFFREAVLNICGNLEIDKALFSTLQFLQKTIPVSWMALEYYDKGHESMRTIAKATLYGGETVDLTTNLSAEAKKQAATKYDRKKSGMYLFENPKEEQLAKEMLEFHGIEASSLIVLSLKSGGQMIGTLALVTEDDRKFTQQQADLIYLLSEPFAVALSNTLKHRSELKLQDREFFWEVTMRICGHLEVEKGLCDCITYLSQHMPADVIYLQRYEVELGTMRFIAKASAEKGELLDSILSLPERDKAAISELSQKIPTNKDLTVQIYNDPIDDPISPHILNSLGEPASSVMVLPLALEGELAGALALLARGSNRFNEDHARLYENLKVPFFVAMSNTLKHRSLLKLYNRDFFWEATTRICGNLELEKGLSDCMKYLSHHMPADVIYLQRYEMELGAMRFIARANSEKGELLDLMISVPEMDKSAISEFFQAVAAGKILPAEIYNNPIDNQLSKHLLSALGEPASSIMVLPLVLEGEFAGGLALIAHGPDRFTESDARLYENLRVPFFVAMSNTLKHREILKLKDLLADDNRFLHDELHRLSGDEIIGAGFGLRDVMFKVQQISSIDSPVLLLGETGVGKDVIANAIHYSSSRSKGPFVSLNCGAIPDTLIDSELFGHEKGAFTGALSQKRGRFERAHKGTIFLDEIGELPLNVQVRLLRVIQNREIERVGGVETIPVDIRIIAATNRNLEEMIKNKQFREDLWFRLNVFPVWIPPLRDRMSDIPELVQHFINLKSKELKLSEIPKLAPGTIDSLVQYHWPGNVRELENVIERALILHRDGPLQFEITGGTTKNTTAHWDDKPKDNNDFPSFNFMVEKHIRHALELVEWKIHGPGGAAELLQMNPNTLRGKMRKMGIPFKK